MFLARAGVLGTMGIGKVDDSLPSRLYVEEPNAPRRVRGIAFLNTRDANRCDRVSACDKPPKCRFIVGRGDEKIRDDDGDSRESRQLKIGLDAAQKIRCSSRNLQRETVGNQGNTVGMS